MCGAIVSVLHSVSLEEVRPGTGREAGLGHERYAAGAVPALTFY